MGKLGRKGPYGNPGLKVFILDYGLEEKEYAARKLVLVKTIIKFGNLKVRILINTVLSYSHLLFDPTELLV